jgi:enoyl-CoA hydratase
MYLRRRRPIMGYENIILEVEGGIATIKINRPKALNALNTATLDELLDVQREINNNEHIRVVVLTGQGKAFVSGGDIGEMHQLNAVTGIDFTNKGHLALSNLENMKKPVIAAVNGYALGGGLEIALACDIVYASERAVLGLPEVTLGIVPGFGGTQRLTRLIGPARAKELILTGGRISALEAYNLGIVNKVVDADRLMGEVYALASKIAAAAPLGVELAKDCVNMSTNVDIESGLKHEARAFATLCGTEDKNEAMTAFFEKRPAVFRGR